MGQTTIPSSVRIRTDDGNKWRFRSIEKAAEFYGCNRSDAVAYACEDLVSQVGAARKVLNREDLTTEQRKEIAETLSTRAVTFEVSSVTEIQKG
ncbi:hypothetical protein Halru_2800 [Halovivax ruber XH-70]|uniref:DUF7692 domain-containing protein n=1 Tax=Halovivax ruber (strain DSM 18193 / JCM 13892 / XH-70) TaxID=797302 RepID=L0IGN5_HALRX|nr:hypothetical protein [Halovivax ruber]AGB17371.1 hypothetical protein Halru_2800 [Halovivax ruber XH-70]